MTWYRVEKGGREWERFYRLRWEYDRAVPSTHGVNCTGSCRWMVYVKDGMVVWEHQAVDYPTNGPDFPDYEPRGCPRGASFSWYIYSPLRIKHPYIREPLLRLWREALKEKGDPVAAWASIVEDAAKAAQYKKARGMGGFVRAGWGEALQLIVAALIYTIEKYGPDRIAGFTPIPAMSTVSFSSGTRFLSLIGGVALSFYDWYADLPPASPQVWGEQTDVPESGDWFNALYVIDWGTNIPMTRTPDAHFYSEVRYRGAKVVAISPDFAEYVKFADEWVAIRPGTDGALALAMGHVILKEFYVDRQTPYFAEYAKKYTDLPALVKLEKWGDAYLPGQLLRASELGVEEKLAEWKAVVYDSRSKSPRPLRGSIGYRWDGSGKWNLDLEDVDPALTLLGSQDAVVQVAFEYFYEGRQVVLKRGVPAKRIATKDGEALVTTVFDLLLAYYGVDRGLGGDYPKGYDDPAPFTPAWQEAITGVPRQQAIKIAREFAENAEKTRGRSLILMSNGVNHWFHTDLYYRSILALVILTGSQGRNGGGWAHYVGQEKIRPLMGFSTVAFALDWVPAARQQNTPSWMYIHSDQYRYEVIDAQALGSGIRRPKWRHPVDYNVAAVRRGWLPFYPQFDVNPVKIYDMAKAELGGEPSDKELVEYAAKALEQGKIKLAVEDPDNPVNFPRVLFVWRANLFASSGKGTEYIMRHLLGARSGAAAKEGRIKPELLTWREPAPEGKLDLVVTLDFRMSTTALYSDVVLPAATWYEKYDISTTDMHPFVHTFNEAVPPQFESKSDWQIFRAIAEEFTKLAKARGLGKVKDIVATPLLHDTPGEVAQPFGKAADWREGGGLRPGQNAFNLTVVERDYSKVYDMFVELGPRIVEAGIGAKGIRIPGSALKEVYEELKEALGVRDGKPSLERDKNVANAILYLSPETNCVVNRLAWESLEKIVGKPLAEALACKGDEVIDFDSATVQPRRVYVSPTWSGIESEKRRYTAFAVNVEHGVPWRTLTGRQTFYLDHPLVLEFGEMLPTYKPPLPPEEPGPEGAEGAIRVRYLTPHGKWQIHSTYFDNWFMLTMFRGGPVIWLSEKDAAKIGVRDNDWVEVYNENGAEVVRAVVTHRVPEGVAILYHATEKTIYTPLTSRGTRGSHNSPTRAYIKPTLTIGGYAQLSWGINYYGPTGVNRDTWVYIRKVERPRWE
ncbi:MAG: nitrate reductase subunit alpha [Thermoproteus sp. AZ2]|uniref:Nitrate reductase subunit alpha n=1 Tax=Thermoproteus sp. AZ2 TaxID=1609232 RepID=A0ACC6V2A2_9CREN